MFDWLIGNALVVDGTGSAPVPGDVGIIDGKIAAVGHLSGAQAAHTVDAAGRVLTPGFIDIHRHADGAVFRSGFGEAELRQGLTTIVNGNCGLSLAPCPGPNRAALLDYLLPITGAVPEDVPTDSLGAYSAALASHGLPLHAGMLVGLGTLRATVAGYGNAPLTDENYRALHRLLEQALADGALGVSLGLGYAPECFFTTAELLRALAPLTGTGIPVTVHMRQEGSGVVRALEEMLTVARTLRTPVEISHLKGMGKENWQKAVPAMLRLLDAAREEGLDVGCDVYPYTAGSTQLIHVLPPECQHGGTEELTRKLSDPAFRAQLRRRMETGNDFENIALLVGFENIVAAAVSTEENKPLEGLSLAEIAAQQGKDCYDALFDLLEAERCAVTMIDFLAHEADIAAILRHESSLVISDATYPTAGRRHPRVCGAFSRVLETYVGKQAVLTLPEAVRKMTALPAARLGLTGKGVLTPDGDADLCLFHPDRIRERATYAAPDLPGQGMDWVFVAGVPAIADGALTGARNGTVLRRI